MINPVMFVPTQDIYGQEMRMPYMSLKAKTALVRVQTFLYVYTNTTNLSLLKREDLILYIKHYKERGFDDLSFAQVIWDVKFILDFINNHTNATSIPDIDLSVNNTALWMSI